MNILGKVSVATAPLQHGRGGVSYLFNKGERYVGAGLFGFAKGYWREKTLLGGKFPADVTIGLGLTLTAAVLQIASRGRSGLAPHLDAFGDAGVMSWVNSISTAWGAKSSGRQVLVLDAGQKAPAQIPAGYTQVAGDLPKAVGGAYLDNEKVRFYSDPR